MSTSGPLRCSRIGDWRDAASGGDRLASLPPWVAGARLGGPFARRSDLTLDTLSAAARQALRCAS